MWESRKRQAKEADDVRGFHQYDKDMTSEKI